MRNILRRRLRTFLTVLGVGLSIGATVSFVGISTGMVAQISAVVSEAGSELTVVQRIPRGLTFGYLGSMPAAVVDALAGMPGVARVSPILLIPAALTKDLVFLVYGVEPLGPEAARARLLSGRKLTPDDGPVVILGRRAAEGMGKGVGDSLVIGGRELAIAGIYRTGVSLEDGGAMMNLRAAREMFGLQDRVSLVKVKAADPRKVAALRRAIDARFPDVTAITSEEFARDRLNLEAAVQAAWAISIIALLLSMLAVANTMATTVLERTREIGILLAVGWNRRRIATLFLGESLLLSCVGGLLGVALGVGALRFLSDTYKALPLPATAAPALLAGALALALTVGAAGGFLPAWWAARLDPVNALRYQ